MSGEPPRLVTWMLRRCLPHDLAGASILGDLREEYERDGRLRGFRYAAAALALAARYAGARVGGALLRIVWQASHPIPIHRSVTMRTLAEDFRDAWRGLRRRPLFSLAAVGLLACGLAATSTVSSFVDAVLLRPLPLIEDAGRLVRIQEVVRRPTGEFAVLRNVLPADMERLAAAAPSLASTAAMFALGDVPISTPDGAVRVPAVRATGGFFEVVGVQPAAGRRFTAEDEQPGRPPVVVLSHTGWRRLFAGRSEAIGSALTVNREPHTVIGVMPAGFEFPNRPDLYLPLTRSAFTTRFHVATGIARVRPGVPLERVRAEVEAVVAGLAAGDPAAGHGQSARVVPWRDAATERVRPALGILVAAAAIVLLLATVNLGGLLADRAIGRTRELSVRRSLGATDGRIVRLLFAEGVLLAAGGALAGLGLTALTLRTVVALSPTDLPFRDAVTLDSRVIAFTAALAVLVGMLAGIVPALRTRRQSLAVSERAGPPVPALRGMRLLVVTQVAAAVVLVSSAGLLLRSFVTALRVDPGVRTEGILTGSVSLGGARWDDDRQRAFFERALEQTRRIPGVTAAEISLFAPLRGGVPTEATRRSGDKPQRLFLNAVSPGFLPLLGVPVLEGRGLEATDDEQGELVGVISQLAAARLFPGASPVGRTIQEGQRTWRVVGVVADVRQEGPLEDPQPTIWVPFRQFPFNAGTFLVTGELEPSAFAASVRAIIRRLDPDVPLNRVATLSAVVDEELAQPRFYSVVVGVFGVLAVGLAVSGLYGLVAFAATRRTFEFGVRLALGARPVDNLWLVYREGLLLALAGAAAGSLLAFSTSHLLETLLYRTEPRDPLLVAAASGTTLLVTLLAVLTPAIRASLVNPVTALRAE